MTKQDIHTRCVAFVDRKIKEHQDSLNEMHESKVYETKSSAGDKFETSTEMIQQEEDKIRRMLMQALKMKQDLSQLPDSESKEIGPGTLVRTNFGDYYMSIGLGKIPGTRDAIFCISMGSPLGMAFKGKVAGMFAEVNGREFIIKEVL